MNTECITPYLLRLCVKRQWSILVSCSLLLTGCITSNTSKPLAPAPPEVNFSSVSRDIPIDVAQVAMDVNALSAVSPAAGAPPVEIAKSLTEEDKEKRCRIQDRFDRKAILAYEWDRSRLALDMDGLNVGFDGISKFEQIKLEFRMKLQRDAKKDKRAACRYGSRWQGVVGSGYNEFFRREDDTVWEEIKALRQEARTYLENVF